MTPHWSPRRSILAPLCLLGLNACGSDASNDGNAFAPSASAPAPSVVGPGGVDGQVPSDPNAPLVPGATPTGGVAPVGTDPAVVVGPEGTTPVPGATSPTPGVTTPLPGDPAPTPGVTPEMLDCSQPNPGRAPLRRLTRFEYNNTVIELLGDTTQPANTLPPELLGNGYGNDADQQPISSFLAEQYEIIAEDIIARAMATPEARSARFPCMASVTSETEASCARSVIDTFASSAYRRPLTTEESDELVQLQTALRANGTFEESINDLMVAILQGPDFLYRVELGAPDAVDPSLRRPTGPEMASRLSFLLWGRMPDPTLTAAAASGELDTPEGVRAHAARMLDDEKALPVLRYFFEHFLPTNTVAELARDPEQYPNFSNAIGALMQEETRQFLEYEVFQGGGTWRSVLTAPYVFVNEELANYYGIPGVTGPEFRRVDVDLATTQRRGLLTQGAILAGTTITNFTNPVRRGGFIIREMMCQDIQLPVDDSILEQVMPPEPYSAPTARLRYEAHKEQAVCKTCHAVLDPPGFALENFDAVGMWRDTERSVTADGTVIETPIDATGDIALIGAPFDGPHELIDRLVENPLVYECFAENWTEYALGRVIDPQADACSNQTVQTAFEASGYNIKELVLSLTQTDAFLYLPAQEPIQ